MHGRFFKLVVLVFAASWVIVLWPSFFSDINDGNKDNPLTLEAAAVRKELSFICRDGDTFRPNATHIVTLTTDLSPSFIAQRLATLCMFELPIRLLSSDNVVHAIDSSLPSGTYYIEQGRIAASVIEKVKKMRKEKDRREMEIEEEELSQRMELRKQYRELEERERNRREILAQKQKQPVQDEQEKIRARTEQERKAFEQRLATNQRQIEPPPDTDRIIYPKPFIRHPAAVSGNITFLSGAINIGRKQHAGKRPEDYRFEDDYLQIMKLVLSWKKPVQLIMQRKYYEMLKDDIHDQALVRIVEIEDLRAWKYYPMIEKIRKTKNWQTIASWMPESPQAYSDLYNPVIMHKVYWLQDLCHLNPFNTKYFMWVDCGVCTTSLSADVMDFLGRRFEAMMEPGVLATNSPAGERHEIQGFLRDKLEQMAGRPAPYIMKGGTFGGSCEKLDLFAEYYDRALSESLRDGYLGTEESIYTIVYYQHPEIFHEFKQERPEWPGQEILCLLNDRSYHLPEFKERFTN